MTSKNRIYSPHTNHPRTTHPIPSYTPKSKPRTQTQTTKKPWSIIIINWVSKLKKWKKNLDWVIISRNTIRMMKVRPSSPRSLIFCFDFDFGMNAEETARLALRSDLPKVTEPHTRSTTAVKKEEEIPVSSTRDFLTLIISAHDNIDDSPPHLFTVAHEGSYKPPNALLESMALLEASRVKLRGTSPPPFRSHRV
jgi:hypothetical protein